MPTAGAAARPQVLIVDDDPVSAFILEHLLHDAGFTTAAARNGADALEAWREHRPRVVLMDLSMPSMDGFEAGRRILADAAAAADAPAILAVSANVAPVAIDRCRRMGFAGFFEKPIEQDALMRRIADLVDGAQAAG